MRRRMFGRARAEEQGPRGKGQGVKGKLGFGLWKRRIAGIVISMGSMALRVGVFIGSIRGRSRSGARSVRIGGTCF